MSEIKLEIGDNLTKVICRMASCGYYHQNGGLGNAIQKAFGIDFSKY